jgi:hypothetical protein
MSGDEPVGLLPEPDWVREQISYAGSGRSHPIVKDGSEENGRIVKSA